MFPPSASTSTGPSRSLVALGALAAARAPAPAAADVTSVSTRARDARAARDAFFADIAARAGRGELTDPGSSAGPDVGAGAQAVVQAGVGALTAPFAALQAVTQRARSALTAVDMFGEMERQSGVSRAEIQRILQPIEDAIVSSARSIPIVPGLAGQGGPSIFDAVQNFEGGYRALSIVAREDPEAVIERPAAAFWFAGAAAAAAAEGVGTELGLLAMLGHMSRSAKFAPALREGATRALRMYGAGEDATQAQRILGSALLGGTATAGTLALTDATPEEVAAATVLTTGAGYVLGQAAARLGAGLRQRTPRLLADQPGMVRPVPRSRVRAAVRADDGRVFTAPMHDLAWDALKAAGGKVTRAEDAVGYVSLDNPTVLLSRSEAAALVGSPHGSLDAGELATPLDTPPSVFEPRPQTPEEILSDPKLKPHEAFARAMAAADAERAQTLQGVLAKLSRGQEFDANETALLARMSGLNRDEELLLQFQRGVAEQVEALDFEVASPNVTMLGEGIQGARITAARNRPGMYQLALIGPDGAPAVHTTARSREALVEQAVQLGFSPAQRQVQVGATPVSDALLDQGDPYSYRASMGVGGSPPGTAAPPPARGGAPDPIEQRWAGAVVKPKRRTLAEFLRDSGARTRDFINESFRFEHGMRKFPSITGIRELDHSRDFEALGVGFQRADRQAEEWLREIVEPLQRVPSARFAEQFDTFVDLVMLRDLRETAERGLQLPNNLTLADVEELLRRREAGALLETQEAVVRYHRTTNHVRDEMIARGFLPAGAGYDHYFTHKVLDDLAEIDYRLGGHSGARAQHPSLVTLRTQGLREPRGPAAREGSDRPISGAFEEVMFRSFRRFLRNVRLQEFIQGAERTFGIDRAALADELEQQYGPTVTGAIFRDLDIVHQDGIRRATLPDGRKIGVLDLTGSKFYRAAIIDDATAALLRSASDNGLGIDPEDLAQMRLTEGLVLGGHKQLILPLELVERYNRFFEPPRPSDRAFNPLRRLTGAWKGNQLLWGIMSFQMRNIIGDVFNLARSNPAAFFNPRAIGNRNAATFPVWRALSAQFARYRTPLASPQQLAAAFVGSVSALGAQEASAEDPTFADRAGAMLAGAGLGYIVGTRGIRIGGRNLLPSKVRMARARPYLEGLYDAADQLGVLNAFYRTEIEHLPVSTLGPRAAQTPHARRDLKLRAWDTIRTFLTGRTQGIPLLGRAPAETWETLTRERENILRLASYIQLVESGMAPQVAAARASDALVNYNRFTDFENRYLRGVFLPFYSFVRHNTPNWLRAMIGRDVGGKGKVALAAVAGLATFDVASQAWNEEFFPEIERNLPEHVRKSFHIILGNPVTGEAHTNSRGQPIVVGWEMPYEMALEFFGLARPGVIYSELFGADFGENQTLVGRVRDAEAWDKLASPLRGVAHGVWRQFSELVTPFVKVPWELVANEKFHFKTPIAPERYFGTPIERERWLTYVAETAFRQLRETRRILDQRARGEFDLLRSPLLGAPIAYVDDRDVRSALHRQMDAVEQEVRSRRAPAFKQVDDIFYARRAHGVPEQGEMQKVQEVLRGVDPLDAKAVARYYIERTARADVARRFESLSQEEKWRLFQRIGADTFEGTAMLYYLNGGQNVFEDARVRAQATGLNPALPQR